MANKSGAKIFRFSGTELILMRAGTVAASVAFAVMMMVAMEVFPDLQNIVHKGDGNCADITFSAADDLYSGVGKGVDRTAADTAANENVDIFFGKQCGKSAVSAVAGGELFFGDDLVVFGFKNGESRRVTEVLIDHVVFTSNSNFHR